MAKPLHLEIAGVRYGIDAGDSELVELPEHYRSFIDAASTGSPPHDPVAVSLLLSPPPDTSSMSLVFETADSWCIRRQGDERFLVLAPPTLAGGHIWVAHFARDCRQVTVYCGKTLFREAGGVQRLANPVSYPLDLLLTMHVLATRRGAIIHAAGLAFQGKSYLIPGRSGAGKSTFMQQFSGRETTQSLSDDRIVVRGANGDFRLHGTPWIGEAGIAHNAAAPHAGILFPRKSTENRIEPLEPAAAFKRLIPLASVPWYDAELLTILLTLLGDLTAAVPAYEFHFRPGPAAADLFASSFG